MQNTEHETEPKSLLGQVVPVDIGFSNVIMISIGRNIPVTLSPFPKINESAPVRTKWPELTGSYPGNCFVAGRAFYDEVSHV